MLFIDSPTRILEETDMHAHRHKRVGDLSGGMKRKLSISIAFIGGSRLVVLDEPTTGVDPCSRRNIWDIVIQYKKRQSLTHTHSTLKKHSLYRSLRYNTIVAVMLTVCNSRDANKQREMAGGEKRTKQNKYSLFWLPARLNTWPTFVQFVSICLRVSVLANPWPYY